MKPEQQRIAIAEFCGWKFHPLTEHLYTNDEKAVAIMCWVRPGNDSWHIERVPDYFSDLNAMHEAEKLLSDKQELLFVKFLNINHPTSDLFSADCDHRGYEAQLCREAFGLLTATAAQRAEALLKTIGKWEETK